MVLRALGPQHKQTLQQKHGPDLATRSRHPRKYTHRRCQCQSPRNLEGRHAIRRGKLDCAWGRSLYSNVWQLLPPRPHVRAVPGPIAEPDFRGAEDGPTWPLFKLRYRLPKHRSSWNALCSVLFVGLHLMNSRINQQRALGQVSLHALRWKLNFCAISAQGIPARPCGNLPSLAAW